MARQILRKSGRVVSTSSVAPVNADNGLKQRLPPQLHPDLIANARPHRRLQPRRDQRLAQSLRPPGPAAVRFAETETVAITMLDHARLRHFRRRINDTTKRLARRNDLPQLAARIDTLHPPIPERRIEPIEIPVRHPVDPGHQRAVRPHHLRDVRRRRRQGMRLQRHEHIVLPPRLRRTADAARVADGLALGRAQDHAVLLHRRQMRPARDEGHIRPRRRELGAEEAADCAGAKNRNFHADSPSFSARPMRCNLPVAPLGISAKNTIFRGTLNGASLVPAKSRNACSSRV